GEVFGRIDVFRSMQARVDGMSVTATYRFVNSPGAIRIGESGYGPELVRSNIVISNNEAYGVDTPIVMHWGAVGVTVINNFVHDFGFAGIRCGADVHFAGDCMLSNISNNIVYNWQRNSSGDADSAGIYYCTHWFSPGNVAECNYVAGGDHCYYLDYVTSGVVIRGGACINTYDGIKVNNGKLNVIKHVILKNVEGMPGWCTCFTPTVNNCRKDPGTYWEAMRLKYYDTELFRSLWPWWPSVCEDTSINGVSCNPPGSMAAYLTGNCSGLGTENYLDLVVVNMTKRSLDYKYCEKIPVMPKLNTHKMINITTSSLKVLRKMGFRNYKRHDLAIESWSPIYQWRPQFKSCRKGLAGMKVITREEYKILMGRKVGGSVKVGKGGKAAKGRGGSGGRNGGEGGEGAKNNGTEETSSAEAGSRDGKGKKGRGNANAKGRKGKEGRGTYKGGGGSVWEQLRVLGLCIQEVRRLKNHLKGGGGVWEQLRVLGLCIREASADGNCFFRAVSDHVFGNQAKHVELRQQVVDYIEEHETDFAPFVEDDMGFKEYCSSMREDSTWGGHMELQAVSLLLKRNICIHQLQQPRWNIVNFDDANTSTIHL
ncbi:unnamed protein product, partial [Closterium sp. NIES-54]